MSFLSGFKKFMNSPPGKILGAVIPGLSTTYYFSKEIIDSINGEESDLDKQISAQKDVNKTNLDFAKEQFEYQKYLNKNQYKIHASDAQSAGINPIAMSGGSLATGSFSAGTEFLFISSNSSIAFIVSSIKSFID